MSELIKIDRPAERVLRLRINRPEKRNAVDQATREALLDALLTAQADTECRALVLGGVDHVFSAGGDLPSMVGMSEPQARARMQHGHRICRLVAESRVPVVSAAEGYCGGAMVGLALLGDFIIASRDTRFLFPFLKLGLVPDWGLLRSLPQRVGLPAARRILTAGRAIDGEEAFQIGLADENVGDADVMITAVECAARLSRLSPTAYARMKARWRDMPATLDDDLRREEDDQTAMFLSPDFREGYAAYVEKRDPVFATPTERNA